MMPLSETSDEETELQTPKFLRRNSRFSTPSYSSETPPLAESSSVYFGPISEDVIRVWKQLPEAIRLDPSLAAIQKEYERMSNNLEISRISNIPERAGSPESCSTPHSRAEKKKQVTGLVETRFDAQIHLENRNYQLPLFRYAKLILLICCWIAFTIILMIKSERTTHMAMDGITVSKNQITSFVFVQDATNNRVSVTLEGSLLPPLDHLSNKISANVTSGQLIVWLAYIGDENTDNISSDSYKSNRFKQNLSELWVIPIVSENLVGIFPDQKREKIFELDAHLNRYKNGTKKSIGLHLKTNLLTDFPVSIAYDFSPINTENGVVYAAVVLLGLYVLIIFEIVHRTLAAVLASTMSIAILAVMNERPTMTELMSWIDMDTLLLLFSMMILVAIIADTGIFDYLAVYAYKITGGKLWPLIITLCSFTASISSILDNVTTVLLMTPVTIRLCEVIELNPVPILTAMVIYSNIGGAMTPVGDPPNVIVASNQEVIKAGIGFGTFVLHMGVGIAIIFVVVYAQLRFMFRNRAALYFDEPQDVHELRHEIAIWQRAAMSLSSYSKDENIVRITLMKKVQRLFSLLNNKLMNRSIALEKYKMTLEELQEKYPIRDKWLLAKCSVTLLFVVILFFLHNLPNLNLSLGWIALLGVLLLLILSDTDDIDGILARVEWSTLLFFASLFVLMEALARLGLISWIGNLTEKVVLSVGEDSRLAVAILLILWVSAIASAFVDNVPLATMMVRIATDLSHNQTLNLPLQPLIWALAFGACMGGNGTLIGATANVVCAGVAEQHGYRFTFMQFFKVGFPIMLTSTATATVYLMICHVVFNWV